MANQTTLSEAEIIRVLNSRLVVEDNYMELNVESVKAMEDRYIINFKEIHINQLDRRKKHLIAKEYQEAMNVKLTASVWFNNKKAFVPEALQKVTGTLVQSPSKKFEGEFTYSVTGLAPVKATQGTKSHQITSLNIEDEESEQVILHGQVAPFEEVA